jgi:hypothetical protein
LLRERLRKAGFRRGFRRTLPTSTRCTTRYNEVCIRFDLPRDRRDIVLQGMRALSQSEVEALPKPCSLRPGWWDDGALDGEVFEALGAPPHDSLVIAADRLGTAIHIWSP